ncbi:MAG: cyclic nucleotide-binding domain-containing protein [Candidatus Rokubacteria bacterium]|nr:cyclic nucleotide-binding domain-containing protein [Candidatus Rokubacteria bacterium]
MTLSWLDLIGYLAALLVFCTFYMKTMIPLRVVAILSNLAFIGYGFTGRLYPVLILHALLLPLNCLRLLQMRALIVEVRAASQGDLSMEWLIPHLSSRRFKKGEVLFRKGDVAGAMYLMLSGEIRLVEIDRTIGPGAVLGEIGVFSPYKARTATAVCESDAEVGSIDESKVLQLYFQNPKFGFYLIRLIIQRLLQNNPKVDSPATDR